MKKIIWFSILPLMGIVLWVLATELFGLPEFIIPSPYSVLLSLKDAIFALAYWGEVLDTITRMGLGFILGTGLGVPLGIWMGMSRGLRNLLIFPVDALRCIPATSIFPIFMLCFGIGFVSSVALVAFPCLWIATINSMYGVRNRSSVRDDIALVMGMPKLMRFRILVLPQAVSSVLASLRLSVAITLHMAVIAEMFMGADSGIGRRIYEEHMLLRLPEMYADIIMLGILGYLLNLVFVRIEEEFKW